LCACVCEFGPVRTLGAHEPGKPGRRSVPNTQRQRNDVSEGALFGIVS
jgi:hypothetical protein